MSPQRTLGEYRKFAILLAGNETSKAVKFFDKKIAEQGEDEPVIAAESQMLMLIAHMIQEEESEDHARNLDGDDT